MGGRNQIGKEVVTFHFLFKMGSPRDIKKLSLTLTWKSESLVAKILNSSMVTKYLQKTYGLLLVSTFWILNFSLLKVKHPIRSIMSAIKRPTYNLAKFLVPLLEPITTNMYTEKQSFKFAKEIVDQDPGIFRASLDAESLFTNILLEETISVF